VANLLTLLFILILCVAGFFVCGVALVSPYLGSLLAAPLRFLLQPLINLVAWIASWPYATYYAASTSWAQCVLLYAALAALAFWPAWRNRIRWQGTALVMAAIFWLPGLVWRGPAVQITVLASGRAPVMVVQSQQETVVINSGSEEVVNFDLLPFLRQQGVRRIDHAIATTAEGLINGGWTQLLEEIPVRNFWDGEEARVSGPYTQVLAAVQANPSIQYQTLNAGDRIPTHSLLDLQVLHTGPLVLSLTAQPQSSQAATWLLLGTADRNVQTAVLQNTAIRPARAEWIWWDASALSRELLEGLQIQGGVASQTGTTPPEAWFQEQGRPLLNTGQEGAVCWHPGVDIYPCRACS
jgi:competence protein ComEC